MELVVPLSGAAARDASVAGGKGAGLAVLIGAGLPVPDGFVLTVEVAERLLAGTAGDADPAAARAALAEADPPEGLGALLAAALLRLDADLVAVRSSAVGEDAADASAAGQQETVLAVDGRDPAAVLAAARRCWASLWGDRATAYRAKSGTAAGGMAVVVQRMVDADAAGVVFTADPRSGRRDVAVVAAARGLGESVVAGDVQPDDLVVDRAAHRVVERSGGAQARERRLGPSGVELRDLPDAVRAAPVLDDAEALRLVALADRAATAIGGPADVEWARDRGRLLLLQARPITALPPAPGPVPAAWPVPMRHAAYFRASIVEQLPDPVSPLFEDLGLPAVTASVAEMMRRLLGPDAVRDGDVALVAVNGYAYYGYATRAFGRLLLRAGAALPAVFRGVDAGPAWWRSVARPAYGAEVARIAATDPAGLAALRLLEDAEALLLAGMRYYTAVQTVVPVAATAEGVFTWYARMAARSPAPVVHLLGAESEPIRADRSLWAVAQDARRDPALAAALGGDGPLDLLGPAPAGVAPDSWAAFRRSVDEHLRRFGHAVFDLDFADPLPADDPGALRAALRAAVTGAAEDPALRQRRALDRRAQADAEVRGRLDPVRRAVFDRLLGAARRSGPAREDALADVGLAWPEVRRRLLELGRRLTAAGAIEHPDQVFLLRRHELVADAARLDAGDRELASRVRDAERRLRVQRGRRLAEPPQLLPERGWGRVFARVMPAASGTVDDELRGVPAGGGVVEAVARVLAGPADADRLQRGEVLVTAITTPAWTPLFAVAGAVVTDVGGPLSHSSIVAREYGIPAVLGTRAATRRIRDGQRVRVDGTAGVVRLRSDGDRPAPAVVSTRFPVLPVAAAAGLLGVGLVVVRAVLRRR